jgi:hypothetical protein
MENSKCKWCGFRFNVSYEIVCPCCKQDNSKEVTCCLVECGKPVMKDSKVNACKEHEELVHEMLLEESEQMEKELYDEWVSDCLASCRDGVRQYYASRRFEQ